MKIVIVGGSSPSTPALFDSTLTFAADRFSFEFVGRSAERLAAVRRAAEMIAQSKGYALDCRHSTWGHLPAALDDADVVLIQFRVGGYDARDWDESFPHRYAMCGDEGLGPGGLAAAWRTWPQLEDVLAAIHERRPTALVILLTSPIGILTRCAREAFPSLRLVGICELPWVTLQTLCDCASAASREATFAYLAVNHLGWFSHVSSHDTAVLSADDIHPLKYVVLLDEPEATLARQRATASRARQLERFAAQAIAVYRDGSLLAILAALRERSTPWYEHAVAPLLAALAGHATQTLFFLTTENRGYDAAFAGDDLLEIPHVVAEGTLQRYATVPWQHREVTERLERLVAYERLAAHAVRSRDRTAVGAALAAHPAVRPEDLCDELVTDVVGVR